MTVGRSFSSYTVDGDRITGLRTMKIESGFRARSTAPGVYRFPTFSNPDGTRQLVRIVSGPFVDLLVSPDDPGVTFQPGS